MRQYKKERKYGGINSKSAKIIIAGLFVLGYGAYRIKGCIVKYLSLNQQDNPKDIFF